MIPPIVTELARAVLAGDAVAARAMFDCITELQDDPDFWTTGMAPTIDSLNLNVRARKAVNRLLWNRKILPEYERARRVKIPATALRQFTQHEFLELKNCGIGTVNHIREELERVGLRLRE